MTMIDLSHPLTTDFPVHRTLLENDVLIIEKLARLDRLPAGRFGRM